MGKFTPLDHYSSWRKIAMGMWNTPGDPTIYGYEQYRMDEILEFYDEIHAASGVKVNATHATVHACAMIMAKHPDLNVAIINGRAMQRDTVDIFCQVAVPGSKASEGDLSGVKLKNADQLDLVEISQALRKRAKKVRAGEDQEIEQQKSTIDRIPRLMMRNMMRLMEFLTWNVPLNFKKLGMPNDPFGSAMVSSIAAFELRLGFAPLVPASRTPLVILPGAIFDRVMPVDGEPKVCKVMQISLTCDHRVFDGLQLGYLCKIIRDHFESFREIFPPAEHFAKHHPDGEEAGLAALAAHRAERDGDSSAAAE